MRSYRKELKFNLPKRRAIVNITPDVERAVRESGVQEGLVLVNAMNITASVFIMMTKAVFTTTMRCGWKNWHRKNPIVSTVITATRIMVTLT